MKILKDGNFEKMFEIIPGVPGVDFYAPLFFALEAPGSLAGFAVRGAV